jgi:hypothetical protein
VLSSGIFRHPGRKEDVVVMIEAIRAAVSEVILPDLNQLKR